MCLRKREREILKYYKHVPIYSSGYESSRWPVSASDKNGQLLWLAVQFTESSYQLEESTRTEMANCGALSPGANLYLSELSEMSC